MTLKNELSHRLRLFKKQPYLFFSISGFIATSGNGLVYITTSWFAYEQLKSVSGVSLLMFLTWTPTILFAPIYGVCTDRFNKKFLLNLSNFARGGVILVFVFFVLMGWSNNIFYLAAFIGIFTAFYNPAAITFISSIVEKKDLSRANTTVDMIYEIAFIAGMGISGLLIHLLGPLIALGIGGVLFLLSGIFTSLMRYEYKKEAPKGKKNNNIIKDITNAVSYIRTNKPLIVIYIVQAFIMVILMSVPILLIPYVKEVLCADTSTFTLFEGIYSLGMFIGCFAAPMICDRIKFKRTAFLLLLFMSIALLTLALNSNYIVSVVLYFVVGFTMSIWSLSIAQAQKICSIEYQGRLQSFTNGISGIGILAIYLAMSLDISWINISYMYIFEGIIASVAALFILVFRIQ